jgi:hypothetical protein
VELSGHVRFVHDTAERIDPLPVLKEQHGRRFRQLARH